MQDFTRATHDSNLQHDQSVLYRQAAAQTAELRQSNRWAALQTGILAAQTAVLGSIHNQMEQVRQKNAEALAIQQELLKWEQLQSHIEEFINQTEKLVAECSDRTSDVPNSTRYFLLVSTLQIIERDRISTAIIRGRDNKAAFDAVLAGVTRLSNELFRLSEVQDALRWAKKLESDRLKLESDRQVRLEKLGHHIAQMRGMLESLQSSRRTQVTVMETFKLREKQIISLAPLHLQVPFLLVIGLFILMTFVLSIPSIIVLCLIDRDRMNREKNSPLDKQIASVTAKLNVLQQQYDSM